jgi:4-amino-4-deoxy-L-arabinose transferase-like glycosyltransferase
MSRRLTWLLVAIVALLAGWTLFWQLGRGSLNDWDEATYAEVAHEMVQTGDWLTPRWNGFPYHEKPPLMYWLMAAGLRVGLSPELAVRLPAACAGAIVILLTLLLGRALFCTWTGITAATLLLIASTAWWSNLVQLSRQGMMDVPLTALTLWTLLHWWHGRSRPRRWLWIGLSLGLAVLVKSFQAIPIILIVATIALFDVPASWLFARSHRKRALIAAGLAIIVFLPWNTAQLYLHGRDFVEGYALIHFKKIARVESVSRGSSYYLEALNDAVPHWWVLGVPAMLFAIWRLISTGDRRALLLLAWLGIPFVLYSLAATKLPWYIVVAHPAIALGVAWLLRALTPQRHTVEAAVVVALIALVALRNARVIEPIDLSADVKALGACLDAYGIRADAIAFSDPSGQFKWSERPTWNIRPSVRFYAGRPMIAVTDRSELTAWLSGGGTYVWNDRTVTHGASPLIEEQGRGASAQGFEVLLSAGEQQLLRRSDPNVRSSSQALPCPPR